MKSHINERIDKLSTINPYWYDKDHRLEIPSKLCLDRSRRIAEYLANTVDPFVYPLLEGGVTFEFDIHQWLWNIDVMNDNTFYAYALHLVSHEEKELKLDISNLKKSTRTLRKLIGELS